MPEMSITYICKAEWEMCEQHNGETGFDTRRPYPNLEQDFHVGDLVVTMERTVAGLLKSPTKDGASLSSVPATSVWKARET